MASVTDTFTRADSDTVGNDSNGNAWAETNGNWRIVSNALTFDDTGDDLDIRNGTTLDSTNHYAQADITWPSNGSDAGVLARFSSSARTYYRGQGHANSDAMSIYKVVAGAFTLVATQAETIGAETRTVRLEVNGTALSLTVGAAVLNTTDSGISAGTRTGVGCYANVNLTFDNFAAGDLGGASGQPASKRGGGVKFMHGGHQHGGGRMIW